MKTKIGLIILYLILTHYVFIQFITYAQPGGPFSRWWELVIGEVFILAMIPFILYLWNVEEKQEKEDNYGARKYGEK